MEYPRFVFISPGPNKCNGGTYGHEIVQNENEHKAAIEAGFSDSVTDALESSKKESNLIESELDDKPIIRRGRKPKEQA